MSSNGAARFDRYNLEERLGQGGLAEVWRAVDLTNGRVVALKRFFRGSGADADRLRAEIELLAAHALHDQPNVVRVFGGGSTPEPYVVMEYMDRGDLGRELAAGPLSVSRTLQVGTAVASALDAAWQAGVTHGDLKPSNILLNSAGEIKLADFNVARVAGYSGASGSSQLLVSFSYAAPEVWEGSVGSASDLYALGCVLYECLTGRPPFVGSYAEVFRAHVSQEPDLSHLPSDTPGPLRTLISELLAKDPANRPPDPHAVHVRLAAMREEVVAPVAGGLTQIGAWVIDAPHPTTPWAWLTHHQQSGQHATVELFFGDAAVGQRIRRAVEVNSSLVPYGGERLYESNRLLLRPGEDLGRQAPAGWIFWVARDEVEATESATGLSPIATANAADRLRRLVAAAATVRVDLDLSPQNLVIYPDGRVHVRRPGLSAPSVAPETAALAALRASTRQDVAPALAAAASLADASDEARMAGTRTMRFPGRPTAVAAAGVAAGAPIAAGMQAAAYPAAATYPSAAAYPSAGVTNAAVLRARNERSNRGGPLAAALLALLALLVVAAIAVVLLGRPGGTPAVSFPAVAVATRTPIPLTSLPGEPTAAIPTAAPTLPVPVIVTTPPPILPTLPATASPTALVLTPPPIITPPPTPTPTPFPTPVPPTPTPPPPPPPPAWSADISASKHNAANGELVELTANVSRSVTGTGYVIQIFNPDTGFVHVQCSTGTSCSIGGRRENTTDRYESRVSAPDGSNVQAVSNPVSVTWSSPATPTPAPGWSVDISSSQQSASNGQLVTITATANRSVTGTGFVIQIFNPDTGFIHKQCSTGSVCSVSGARQDVTVRYQARISLPDGSDVQAQSNPVTVTWQ
jgi:hypothetical protein